MAARPAAGNDHAESWHQPRNRNANQRYPAIAVALQLLTTHEFPYEPRQGHREDCSDQNQNRHDDHFRGTGPEGGHVSRLGFGHARRIIGGLCDEGVLGLTPAMEFPSPMSPMGNP